MCWTVFVNLNSLFSFADFCRQWRRQVPSDLWTSPASGRNIAFHSLSSIEHWKILPQEPWYNVLLWWHSFIRVLKKCKILEKIRLCTQRLLADSTGKDFCDTLLLCFSKIPRSSWKIWRSCRANWKRCRPKLVIKICSTTSWCVFFIRCDAIVE